MTFLSTRLLCQWTPLSLIAPLMTLQHGAWMDSAMDHARQLHLSHLGSNSRMGIPRLRYGRSRSPKRSQKWFQLLLSLLPLEALFELALHLLKYQLPRVPRFTDQNP